MSFLQAFHCQLGSDPQKRSAAGAQQKKNHQINGKPSRVSLMHHPNQSTNIPGWQKSFGAAVLSGRGGSPPQPRCPAPSHHTQAHKAWERVAGESVFWQIFDNKGLARSFHLEISLHFAF